MRTEVQTTEATEEDRRPWWLRLRAAAGLSVLVVVLGVTAAAMLGLARAGPGRAPRPRPGMTRPGRPVRLAAEEAPAAVGAGRLAVGGRAAAAGRVDSVRTSVTASGSARRR